MVCAGGSPIVAFGPAASASPENIFKKQILKPNPKPSKCQTLGVGPCKLNCNKPSRCDSDGYKSLITRLARYDHLGGGLKILIPGSCCMLIKSECLGDFRHQNILKICWWFQCVAMFGKFLSILFPMFRVREASQILVSQGSSGLDGITTSQLERWELGEMDPHRTDLDSLLGPDQPPCGGRLKCLLDVWTCVSV